MKVHRSVVGSQNKQILATHWTQANLKAAANLGRWDAVIESLKILAGLQVYISLLRFLLLSRALALAAIAKSQVVQAYLLLKDLPKPPEPVLYEEQSVCRRRTACCKLPHLRTQVADLAHFEHLALVVNGVQAEQVVRDIRTVADTTAAAGPDGSWNAFQKNRMRLRHN